MKRPAFNFKARIILAGIGVVAVMIFASFSILDFLEKDKAVFNQRENSRLYFSDALKVQRLVLALQLNFKTYYNTGNPELLTEYEKTLGDLNFQMRTIQKEINSPVLKSYFDDLGVKTKVLTNFWNDILQQIQRKQYSGNFNDINTEKDHLKNIEKSIFKIRIYLDRQSAILKSKSDDLEKQITGRALIFLVILMLLFIYLIASVYKENRLRMEFQRSLENRNAELTVMYSDAQLKAWLNEGVKRVYERINKILDSEEILKVTIQVLLDYLSFHGGSVMVWEEETESYRQIYTYKIHEFSSIPDFLNDGLIKEMEESGRLVFSELNAAQPVFVEIPSGSILCTGVCHIPISLNDRVIAILNIFLPQELNENQKEFITVAATGFATYYRTILADEKIKKLLEELEEKNMELTVSGKYKSEFLANMSHELRTPLNSILILAKLINDDQDKNLTDKQKEYSRIILKSGKNLLHLINEVLDLSKIESGKVIYQKDIVQLSTVCNDLHDQFREMAAEKHIDFSFDLEWVKDLYFISDKYRLEQILRNLISNAIKFTDDHGHVCLKVKTEIRGGEEFLIFLVVDTGIGIPEDKQEIIFEAFLQADGATNRKYGGTGLGLAISSQLATGLGGKLGLDKSNSEGSVFSLLLPLIRTKQPLDHGPSAKEKFDLILKDKPSQPSFFSKGGEEERYDLQNIKVVLCIADIQMLFSLHGFLEKNNAEVIIINTRTELTDYTDVNSGKTIMLTDINEECVPDGFNNDTLSDIKFLGYTFEEIDEVSVSGYERVIQLPVSRFSFVETLKSIFGQ